MSNCSVSLEFLARRLHRPSSRPIALVVISLSCMLGGCASFTNPVANGIAVRRLPPELLGDSKNDKLTIPLTYLRQKPPDVYRLEPGDVLGIWIEGILGAKDQPPPISLTEKDAGPPALGYPIPVRADGTISLPLVDPLHVHDMTLIQAEQAIRETYTLTKQILQPGRDRIIVTLMRPRRYNVLVVRQDSGALTLNQGGTLAAGKRGTGTVLALAAGENDVMTALVQSGGLPGTDARNEVLIMRETGKAAADRDAVARQLLERNKGKPGDVVAANFGFVEEIRIPLRLHPNEEPPFSPEDVILKDGDILFLETRETELFYTGGMLGSREVLLPRDYDLDVVQAVAQLSGPLVNGGLGSANNFTGGGLQLQGIGGPNPSQLTVLRRTPGDGQVAIRVDLNRALVDPRERINVQPGDVLILQETLGEAFARYFTNVFAFDVFWQVWRRRDSTGVSTLGLP